MQVKQISYAAVTAAAVIAAIILTAQSSDRWKGLLTGVILGISGTGLMTSVYTNS